MSKKSKIKKKIKKLKKALKKLSDKDTHNDSQCRDRSNSWAYGYMPGD